MCPENGKTATEYKRLFTHQKFCMGSLLTKIEGFQPIKIFWDPPYPPHYHIFGGPRGVYSNVFLGYDF
jgi:hypothetical protein